MVQSEAIAMPQTQFKTGTMFLQGFQCWTKFSEIGVGISHRAFLAAGSRAQRHLIRATTEFRQPALRSHVK